MNFSFIIITQDFQNSEFIHKPRGVDCSINAQCMLNCAYERIYVDDHKTYIYSAHKELFEDKLISVLDRDFSSKPGWITAKKNYGASLASYDNLVIMHDYIRLEKGWFDGFIKFNQENPDWELGMNLVYNKDGTRFRDWVVFESSIGNPWHQFEKWCPNGIYHKGSPYLAPYDYKKTENMIISGSYFICKKYIMEQEPLNEELVWGEGEDHEASIRWLQKRKFVYKMNTYSSVKFLKQKDVAFPYAECYD